MEMYNEDWIDLRLPIFIFSYSRRYIRSLYYYLYEINLFEFYFLFPRTIFVLVRFDLIYYNIFSFIYLYYII